MGKRLVGPPLRGRRSNPAGGASLVAGAEAPGNRCSGRSPKAHCRQPSSNNGSDIGPRVFEASSSVRHSLRSLVFLELFSGTARLAKAISRRGLQSLAYDVNFNEGCDLLCPKVVEGIKRLIREKHVGGVWLGFPCNSWSLARRDDGVGPPPLRNNTNGLFGLPNLSPSDQKKVDVGNALLLATIDLAEYCVEHNVPFAAENPASSRAWLVKNWQPLFDRGASFAYVDYCQYGMPWKKRTALLHWGFPELAALKSCSGVRGLCSRHNKPHQLLKGRDEHGVFYTFRAQEYPHKLVDSLSDTIVSQIIANRYNSVALT